MSRDCLILFRSSDISRFEGQLLPALQARGVVEKDGRIDMAAWIRNWLGSDTGFFWCAVTKHPEVGGVYLVHPRERSDENGVFTIKFRIGDCRAEITTNERMPDSFYVRVLEADRGKARTEPCAEPKMESPYSSKTKVFHTADGVTGQIEAFAETEALQLVNVCPNERMAIDDLSQLPERISVRKDRFPLNPVLLNSGTDQRSAGYGWHCECDNCNGKKEIECEKCGGSGQLTCDHCGGSGSVDCKKCGGSGTITLPARDVTCKKCGGSGDYYREGNYIGDCSRCGGSGTIHQDAHDVECNSCGGTGRRDCRRCNGSGAISCFACKGEGMFECWVCGGTGSLRVQEDSKPGKFVRKYKGKEIWLSTNEVYLLREADGDRIPLSGHWTNLLHATEKQLHNEEEAQARAARITQDGHAIDSCLEKVLRLSPTSVRPFEIRNPVAATGCKAKGRVFYEFKVFGNPPWLSTGPFRASTPVIMEGVAVPEGKSILYESCDEDGRRLVFSFPVEVDASSLEGRRLEVRADSIPPPERRERERLGFWLDDSGAPVFRGLVEGVEEKRADVEAFFNERISKFPTQADAIRQGLSDTPVLLLKGPPGTGKTTVIVELIRQAIRQGKRVLLTSQTHQAVDNVLERLHKFRESGEDRKARMAVYAANESKLSNLGRLYMAGGQEEELKEIRQRAEENHERLEAECTQNRTIRSILADGTETAKAIVSRLAKRDASLRKEEKSRDADLEGIAARHAEETARESHSFGAFKGGNTKRKNTIQASIDACNLVIRELEKERDWFDRQAKRRSEKSGFAKNTGVGRFLRKATDRALRGIDSIAGTHLDLENAREAWRKANESLNATWAEKRSHEAELANNDKELYDRTAAHDELLQSIDEQNNAEQEERRAVADNVFKSIREASDDDTKPLYDAQSDRVSQLLAVNADEAGKLRPESSPREWEADIPSLDNEFSDLDVRRKFALDWAGELANSEAIMNRFLNAQTNVFFATCVGMGSWKALSDGTYEMRDEAAGGSGRTIFDLAIVDEAGHATFAETVVPLCSAKKAILIGDDKQLPPMLGDDLDCRRRMDEMCDAGVKTSDGKSCWFEYSMFQYLWENEEVFKIPRLMLDTQFRMHPDIGDFISQTFYEGELKNGVTEEERRFAFGSFRNAVCLLSTSNQKNRFEEWIGTSCRNQLEAEYVQGVVEELLAAIDAGSAEGDLGGKPLSLAVITPYAAQEALLKRGLSKCYRETDRISFAEDDIASVDRFQGDERDVVIASFVRSPNTNNGKRFPKLTFVHDMKRMNVAFSRAKRMLILVGDMKALETAPGNEGGRKAFARFHEHVDARGREILVWEREVR